MNKKYIDIITYIHITYIIYIDLVLVCISYILTQERHRYEE